MPATQPGPRPDPHLRAADSDRRAVAERLGQHLSEGRLTFEEYDERLAKAYAARTYGDLDALFTDLPQAAPVRPAPAPVPVAAPVAGGCAAYRRGARGPWASWASVAVIVTAIWLFTSLDSGIQPFWPMWVIGPWGAVLLARTIGGPPRHTRYRRR